jgi:hypothetical protein
MFKIGEAPSLQAGPVEHADFLELECLRQSDRNASGSDLAAALGRVDDDLPEDRPRSDTRMENVVDDAFSELDYRAQQSGGGPHVYPFSVSESARLLQLSGTKGNWGLYLFMLFATRMNMKDHKIQGGIDGTALFEEICCEVAKNYWGERADGMVFGTARRTGTSEVGAFPDAVNDLCKRLQEGVEFCSHSGFHPAAQDGNLDVVVWKHFTDGKHGKLVGFGQCKTGTHWKNGLFEMVPTGFCQKWVRTQPVVEPVRLYFMTSRLRHSEWYDCSVDGGILFDRCRILDYAPKMTTLKDRWLAWTRAAMKSQKIRLI